MLTGGYLRGNTNPTPYFLSMVACGGKMINVGVPWPRPLGGTASVVQRTLQGQEEADAPKTTSLPASFLFPSLLSSPLSSFSPGRPSMSHLLKNLCFRLDFLGNQTKTCYQRGPGKMMSSVRIRENVPWGLVEIWAHLSYSFIPQTHIDKCLPWSGLSSRPWGHNSKYDSLVITGTYILWWGRKEIRTQIMDD